MILHPETNGLVRGIVKAHTSEALTFFAERFKEGTLHGDMISFALPAISLDEAEHVILGRLQNILTPPEKS